jgi:hypothetical protein
MRRPFFFSPAMIRFPSDCRDDRTTSHLVNCWNFFFFGGSARVVTPHVLGRFWRAGQDDNSSMVAMRRFWPRPSPRLSVKSCQSEGSESARVLCCDSRTSQSPCPLLPPPRRSPRPAADQFNVCTEVADDRCSCRSSCPCWLLT